jgi:hypothetical protein
MAKPNISSERLSQMRAESQQLRPLLTAEMPAVRDEWREWTSQLSSIVARHSKEIDDYIEAHGPMTREEVVERALTKFLSET